MSRGLWKGVNISEDICLWEDGKTWEVAMVHGWQCDEVDRGVGDLYSPALVWPVIAMFRALLD
jgi:hypothetical protein